MYPPPQQISFGAILFATAGISFVVWRLILWIREARTTPDPWDTATAEALQQPEAQPVCHHCFAPQAEHVRFCPECGCVIGAYNNLLPYVYIFSIGEAFRTGTVGKYRVSILTVCGFFFWSLAEYFIFAPVYWFFWLRNLRQISKRTKKDEATNTV